MRDFLAAEEIMGKWVRFQQKKSETMAFMLVIELNDKSGKLIDKKIISFCIHFQKIVWKIVSSKEVCGNVQLNRVKKYWHVSPCKEKLSMDLFTTSLWLSTRLTQNNGPKILSLEFVTDEKISECWDLIKWHSPETEKKQFGY